MRTMLIGIQFVAVLVAIIIIWFYPLTRSKSEATRRLLDERTLVEADSAFFPMAENRTPVRLTKNYRV